MDIKNIIPAILFVLIVCLLSACAVKNTYHIPFESNKSNLNTKPYNTVNHNYESDRFSETNSFKSTDTSQIKNTELNTNNIITTQNAYENTEPLTTKIAVTNRKAEDHLQIPTRSVRNKWNFEMKVSEVHANDKLIYVEIIDNDNQGFTLDLADFELEFMQDSQWINITNSTMISSENYFLPQESGNAFAKFKLFVKKITDQELVEGTYRLVGIVSGKKIYAEFDVLP